MKKNLQRWLGWGGGVALLGLIIYNLRGSPEWRHFDWERTWTLLTHARPGFLLASLGAVYATYWVRAYRWRALVRPIKKVSLWIVFVGQVLGFSSVYLVGRAGEFVRPAYIARQERLPFTSMLAVWVLERVYDSFFIFLLSSVALSFLPPAPIASHESILLNAMRRGGEVLLGLTVLMVPILVLFRLRTERVIAAILKLLRTLPEHARQRIGHGLRSFADGLGVIRSWRDFGASLGLSTILWFLNTSVFWLVMRGLGSGLAEISWLSSAVLMFCASLGLMVQLPGIGGGYQVGIILALTEFFGVRAEIATGGAIMIWLMISVPCLALGLALLVHEGLNLKKLEAIAEEEGAAVRGMD
ncbi:MAG TPA: lysylphosphatidylglycerol synthase transmembrane domain-containing protein [Terriglobia bacterium]|nr:lysylphosphatidylglycerol synthase transmembrane domain-containing protein [Terriglobia bacterium]